MPTEIEQAVARARQESESFMQRSRAQMVQTYQEQRAVTMGGAPVQGAGMSEYPQMGTPAGRLMDTLTTLVRRGSQMGTAAVAPVGQMIAGAGAGVGAGIGFAATQAPYGIGGTAGGMGGAGRGLGFFQTAFAAVGEGLPFGLGKFASQRMDMTRRQARTLAREEMSYRFSAGAREAAYDTVDALSFGLLSARMRRSGQEFGARDIEFFTRFTQEQLRYTRPEALEARGMTGEAGVMGVGLSRRGARPYARALAEGMGRIQAETGISRREAAGLAGAAGQMMGSVRLEQAFGEGPQAYGRTMERQSRAVREIRQGLNLSEEAFQQFTNTMGQMYGTAERIAQMMRTAKRSASRWGMNRNAVFEMLRGFEDVGRQAAPGGAATAGALGRQVGVMRQWEREGMFSRDEMYMYGGQNAQEALQMQARVRQQQNLAMWNRGGMVTNIGMMATQAPGVFERFMGGGMGFMGAMGAVGGVMAQDPTARIRAMYDPRQERLMGQLGGRIAFGAVQAMQQQGMFGMFGSPEQQRTMAMHRFVQESGLGRQEGRQRYEQYEREILQFRNWSKSKYKKGGDGKEQGRQAHSIYQKIIAQDAGRVAMEITGTGSLMQAAQVLYDRASNGGNSDVPVDKSIEDILTSTPAGMAPKTGDSEAAIRTFMKPVADVLTDTKSATSSWGRFWQFGEAPRKRWKKFQESAEQYMETGRTQLIFEEVTGEAPAQDWERGYQRRLSSAFREKTFTPERLAALTGTLRRGGATDRGIRKMLVGGSTGWMMMRPSDEGEGEFWASVNGRGQILRRQTGEQREISLDELRSMTAKGEDVRFLSQMVNNVERLSQPGVLEETLKGYREGGLAISSEQMAVRTWKRGRATRELLDVFGGRFGGEEGIEPGNVDLRELLRGMAISDDITRKDMKASERMHIQNRLMTTGAMGRYGAFIEATDVSGPWKTGQLEWTQVATAQERAGQIQAATGIKEHQLNQQMAKMFNQSKVSFAGVEAGGWTKANFEEVMARSHEDAKIRDRFFKETRLAGGAVGNLVIDHMTTAEGKVAIAKSDGSSNLPFYVEIQPDSIKALKEAMG